MKTVGKILLGILDGIAKALAFVLISLGLWLPALFTVAFFIGCGATHTPLGKGIMTFYLIGLGITAICGFTLAMYLRARKKRKLSEGGSVQSAKKSKKKNSQVESEQPPQYAQPNPYAQNYYGYPPPPSQPYPPYYPPPPQPQSYTPPPQQNYAPPPPQNNGGYNGGNSYREQPRPEPSRTDTRDLDRKYFPEQPAYYERTASFNESDFPQDYGRTMSKSEQREADSKLNGDELWRRLSGADVPDEKPLVFRTRKDPDLYVYEYSDRYQYWRRTGAGMVFESTEWKKKESRSV